MMSIIFLTVAAVFYVTSCNGATKWHEERKDHKLLKLSKDDIATFANRVDMHEFESILDPLLIPRVAGTAGNAQVRKLITGFMKNLGWTLQSDPFTDKTPYGNVNFVNIIATQNPRAHRRLVLACHYDSKLNREETMVTATDSAVPCSMMLHIAKNLHGAVSQIEDVSLQFIFFDGEEAFKDWTATDSIYGSRHMAAQLEKIKYPANNQDNTNELHRMDAFVLLDLIGAPNPKFYDFFPETSHLFSELKSLEKTLGSMKLLKKYRANNPCFVTGRMGSGIEDDHKPFESRGVPILHVIAVPFPDVWHKESDNKENLDFDTIESLTKVIQVFVAEYLHLTPDSS